MLMYLSRFLDRTGIFDVFLTPVPVPFKVQIPHLIGAITALRGTLNPVCDAGPARCIFMRTPCIVGQGKFNFLRLD
jgi:hypothetical protein